MAFYATAKKGEVSRVVPRLGEGTSITTPRMDVQYLATEYGIVNLKQKSVRERALALISRQYNINSANSKLGIILNVLNKSLKGRKENYTHEKFIKEVGRSHRETS